jgi:hypothetical protein
MGKGRLEAFTRRLAFPFFIHDLFYSHLEVSGPELLAASTLGPMLVLEAFDNIVHTGARGLCPQTAPP